MKKVMKPHFAGLAYYMKRVGCLEVGYNVKFLSGENRSPILSYEFYCSWKTWCL